MDFVRCRYFRKSLVCHNSARLNRAINSSVVQELLILSSAAPENGDVALDPSRRITYLAPGGGKLTCRAPLTKLALNALKRAWPMPMTFAGLLAECRAEAGQKGYPMEGAAAAESLASDILTGIGAGVIEWRVTPVAYTTTVGDKPSASALARMQAMQGYRAANLRGELITLDEIHRQTLKHLDGSRNLAGLSEILIQALKAGEFLLHPENEKTVITDEAEMRRLLGSALGKVLENLARQAFLSARTP
jgi:methyltransferase-like protein